MNLRNFLALLLVVAVLAGFVSAPAAEKARLVHNSLIEIDACKGNLNLKPVRVWGGDEEDDENKFFKTPAYIAVDKNKNVYISDMYSHNIKVFDAAGKYLRTIGRKGQGPGDLYRPQQMTFTPMGELVVHENGSLRLQYFNPLGKSKRIRRLKGCVHWFGITSDNQLLVYEAKKTYKSKTLVSLLNKKGKSTKDIGVFHDTAKGYMESELLHVALDGDDTIIVSNSYTPVIRKYIPSGDLTLAITYDTPFEYPVEIKLTPQGNEIEVKRPDKIGSSKIKRFSHRNGISFQKLQTRGILETICKGVGIDGENRIYLLVLRRERPLEEIKRLPGVISTNDTIETIDRGLPLDREMDHLRILVFNPEGEVIAEAPVTKECDAIIVSGNRLFLADPFKNKRILEYEIQLKNSP